MKRDIQVIVGLGTTGFSCARYLQERNIPFAVTDTRANPPKLDEFKACFPNVPISVGQLDEALFERANTLIVSPGISLKEPIIAKQIEKKIPVVGDIELFAQKADAPVLAITGTNAKSTVTTLVGLMAENAGKKAQVGGNLGIPALDLLISPRPDLFVLELSSFQLETTYSLAPTVATVLNITPDHMDRYDSFEDYIQAKQHIYSQCKVAVCNRDDPLTECHFPEVKEKLYFTLQQPGDNTFGLVSQRGENYLAFQNALLMPVKELPILGRHYQANALAALAMGHGFGLPMAPMLETLINFTGLPHRCQLVREHLGVYWYNDSKGTNVGATLAAIEGLGPEISGKLILIAGGVGKNADFSLLVPAIEKYVKTVVLIGEAAPQLADVIGERAGLQLCFANSMDEAVFMASQSAMAGDSVLLSPACASFDMFNHFAHRGEVFCEAVKEL